MSPSASRALWLIWILAISSSIGVLGFYWFFDPNSWADPGIDFHPEGLSAPQWAVHYTFMFLGIGTFLTLAVNAQRTVTCTATVARALAALLHTLALSCVLFSFTFVFLMMSNLHGKHWSSFHAQVGLVLIVAYIAVYCLGMAALVMPKAIGPARAAKLSAASQFLMLCMYLFLMCKLLMVIWSKQGRAKNGRTNFAIPLSLVSCITAAMGTTVFNIYHRTLPTNFDPRAL